MVDIVAEKVTPRGVGVQYTNLTTGSTRVPASRTGIAHFRNKGSADLVLSVTIADSGDEGLGTRTVTVTVPAGATRFVALTPKLAGNGDGIIDFVASGDLSNADVVVLERA